MNYNNTMYNNIMRLYNISIFLGYYIIHFYSESNDNK